MNTSKQEAVYFAVLGTVMAVVILILHSYDLIKV